MWTSLEPWQLVQLERLAETSPERVERALNILWDADPDLLAEVAIEALDQDEITPDRCSQMLGIALDEVESRLTIHRKKALKRCCVVVAEGAVAKLADGGLPVWEVVRVYRKLGSIEKLQEAFAGVSTQTLDSALAYAKHHPDEIENQINRYEQMLERKRAEYPFAK